MTETLQLSGIPEADIDDNDILLGRGGKTNHHPGNATYLRQIEQRQVEYMLLPSRTEKTEYAMNYVKMLRKEGIRFLKKDDKDGKTWSDVGDLKMREKVSQNLREHQPKLKKQMAAEKQAKELQQKQKKMQQQQQQQQQAGGQLSQNDLMQQQRLIQMQHAMAMASMNGGNLMNGAQFPNYPNNVFANGVNNGMNNGMSNGMNNGMNAQQQQAVLSSGMPPLNGANSTLNQQDAAILDPLPFSRGGTGDQQALPPFNEVETGPSPAMERPNLRFSATDERERDMLELVGAGNHNLQRLSSLTMLPEMAESSFQLADVEASDRAFAKQQACADREHENFQGNNSIAEGEEEPITNGGSDIAKPIFGARCHSVASVDLAAVMGESTHSLLDTLNVDSVPEETEGDLSPVPNRAENTVTDTFTPVLSNRRTFQPPFAVGGGDPATVTPNPNSPKNGQQKMSKTTFTLDNDVLSAWANSNEDDDADLAANPFATAQGSPFRRSRTNPEESTMPPKGSTMPRRNTTPVKPPPFGTASPAPRKTASEGGARPSALTKDKRATSNVNETPETHRHIMFQESPLGGDMNNSFTATANGSFSSSSTFSSVKKASLGRDKSAQSQMLKQQCMPEAYGAGSFSTLGTATTAGSSASSTFNGWGTPVNFAAAAPLTPNTGGGEKLTREVTPKTQSMLQDFGKMAIKTPPYERRTSARTAETFEDTFGNANRDTSGEAEQMPMDLMVKKPAPLMWRNRTSTIEALDLDCLDEDPVLQGEGNEDGNAQERRRTSRNSFANIAGQWANMPSSADFDALVNDIAGKQVGELVYQPGVGKKPKSPGSLALPTIGQNARTTKA